MKILDFGLAKVQPPGQAAADATRAPTITTPALMTGIGVILSTAAYMSPEQAKGGGSNLLNLPPAAYDGPRVSPDGRMLAVTRSEGRDSDIWIYDLSGETQLRRLTFGGNNRIPVWSHDGRRVTFQSSRARDQAIWWQPVEGGAAEKLTRPASGEEHVPESWSLDGRHLLFTNAKAPTWPPAADPCSCTLWVEHPAMEAPLDSGTRRREIRSTRPSPRTGDGSLTRWRSARPTRRIAGCSSRRFLLRASGVRPPGPWAP